MHSFMKFLLLSTGMALMGCSHHSGAVSSSASAKAERTDFQGYYKIGNPYQVAGTWYYPKEDYNYKEIGISSWYGPDFHNGVTANGERYDMHGLTAAHRTLPLPSVVRVTNLQNNKSLVLRVNDRGPFVNNRIIDVSMRAAQLLGFKEQGTTHVKVEILPEESKKLKEQMLSLNNKQQKITNKETQPDQRQTSSTLSSQKNVINETSVNQKLTPPKNLGQASTGNPIHSPFSSERKNDQPLISSAAKMKGSDYNDWDEDLTKAQAQKSVFEMPAVPTPLVVEKQKPAPVIKKTQVIKHDAVKNKKSAQAAFNIDSDDYYVQVGAFNDIKNAEKMYYQVSKFGNSSIWPITIQGKTYYRVRVGPENAKKALEIMDNITNSGISGARLVEEREQ